ncbi:helicase-associated domain-containing protein [Paenibacillus hamazuiensis]|uniref:helicase-associated domain-containing protein n=1 Tax=Paenibacillus hamazuiensis TaxID=2936508 RepID=UPI00200D50E5|nr:helicase-associated domain-containing protein [Paenibacillus hamazuiensis]
MNASDMLEQMPDSLRRAIEANEALSVWLKRGHTLEEIYTSPDLLEAVYHAMSRFERRVLEAIVKRIGSDPFTWSELEKCCAPALTGAQAKVGFVLLLRKGLVAGMLKSWGEHVYALPEDTMGLCQQLLLGPSESSGGALAQAAAPRPGIGHALFSLLVYIAKHEVTLTQKGMIHKKHLQKLGERLRLSDDGLGEAGFAYTFADQYAPSLALVLDAALRFGLIEAVDGRYSLCPDQVKRWIGLSAAEQNGRLYRWWKPVTSRGTVLFSHFIFALEQKKEREKLSLDEIKRWMVHRDIEKDEGKVADAWNEWMRVWVRPCVSLGFLEVTDEGEVYWPTKPIAGDDKHPGSVGRYGLPEFSDTGKPSAHNPTLYVQPDFEIVAPPAETYAVRWELECIGELQTDDHAAVYKLTKESIIYALEQGRTARDIIEFLTAEAMYGVPDNVRLALEEWGSEYGKVRLEQVTLLRCRDEATAGELETHPHSARFVLEKISPRDFLVSADNPDGLHKWLKDAGYLPAKTVKGPGQPERREEAANEGSGRSDAPRDSRGRQGLLLHSDPAAYFKPAPQLPDIRDLYPSFQDIPVMWWKDYRSYHPTTRKELVQKAIEWKTALQLRRENGDTLLIPRHIQETRGTWLLYGTVGGDGSDAPEGRELTLAPEQWDEMKLIVPGINDK